MDRDLVLSVRTIASWVFIMASIGLCPLEAFREIPNKARGGARPDLSSLSVTLDNSLHPPAKDKPENIGQGF